MSRYRVVVVTVLLVGTVMSGAVGPATATPASTAMAVETAVGAELRDANETMTLNASAGATIVGSSDLPPGTAVTVRVRASGETPFLRSISTTIDRSGRFRAVTDLSMIPSGTPFTVTVHYNGTTIAETTGEVSPCNDCESTPTSTTIEQADDLTLPAGQGIAIRGEANIPPGSEVNIRLKSSGGNPFFIQRTARVNRTGQFRAVVDLSKVQPDSQFELSLRYNDTQRFQTTGTVVDCEECDTGDGAQDNNRLDVPNTFELVHGETPAVPITMNNATEGKLVIGDSSVNYHINATVRDGDGDGSVWVNLNLSAAGRPGQAPSPLSVRNERDTVTVTDETALPAGQTRLDVGEYPVRVYHDGERVDSGVLILLANESTSDKRESDTADETALQNPAFGFERNIVSTYRGQKLSLAVELGTAEIATLQLGEDGSNYTATITVEDGNGDGRVELLVDTTAIDGDGGAWRVVDSADRLQVRNVTASGPVADTGTLQIQNYPLSVHRGTNTSAQPTDIGLLAVNPAPGGNPTITTGTTGSPVSLDGLSVLAIGSTIAVIGLVVIVRATQQ